MSARRDRYAKAVEFLRKRSRASALEIGAAVDGEAWARPKKTWRAAGIGLQIAVAMTRDGVARPTKGKTTFEIVAA